MKHTLLRASIAVSGATILLRLLGFLREVVLAATYGAGTVTDAFVIAMTVPGIVLSVVNNAVNASYIPQYQSSDKGTNEFTDTIVTLLFIFGLAFALTFAVFPRALVYVFASKLEPESFAIAAKLLQVMVWSAIPMLLAGILRAFLQIKSKFFIAMLLDAVVNITVVLSIIAGKISGLLIAMGVGAVAGNILCVILLFVICVRNGFRFRPRLNLRDERVRAMFRQMLPIIISVSVLEINQIVDKNLASSLVSGTVSSLNYAVKITNVVTALVGSAVGTALFPKMSELAAVENIGTLKKHLITCILTLLPFLLPLTVGVVFMAKPVIRILLERGAFNPEDTVRTAECLQMYAIGIISANLSPIVIRAFYAMKQTKTPAFLSAVSVAVGIAMNLLLIGSLQHRGLALATSMSNTLCFILLLAALRKKVGALALRSQAGEFLKILAAAAVMGAFVVAAMSFLPLMSGAYLQCLLGTAVIAGIAVVLYGAMLMLLRVEIARKLVRKIFARGA